MDISSLVQESRGLKPDWFDEIRSFSIKSLNILSNINSSRIFLQIGKKDTGR